MLDDSKLNCYQLRKMFGICYALATHHTLAASSRIWVQTTSIFASSDVFHENKIHVSISYSSNGRRIGRVDIDIHIYLERYILTSETANLIYYIMMTKSNVF